MKVSVEQSICSGFGNCVVTCSEVFRLDDESNRSEVISENPPTRLHAAVVQAADECPTAAIEVSDEAS
jgi:ferredoxin